MYIYNLYIHLLEGGGGGLKGGWGIDCQRDLWLWGVSDGRGPPPAGHEQV